MDTYALEKLTGWRRDEVLGRVLSDVLVPEDGRQAAIDHTRPYLESGEPGEFSGRIRVPILRADGSTWMAELTRVPMTVDGQV